MSKYEVTFSCGHTAEVYLSGKMKDREWKINKMEESGMCPECYKKWKEEQHQKALQKIKEEDAKEGLPELTGTEKQVEWATILRSNRLDDIEGYLNVIISQSQEDCKKGIKKQCEEIYDYFASQKESKYWIDNRNRMTKPMIQEYVQNRNSLRNSSEAKQAEESAKVEATVYPTESKTSIIAEIRITEATIEVVSDKDRIIITTVKELKYKWEDGVWQFKLSPITGTAADRAAEVGNALLNAGVPIIIYDAEIRQNAIDGRFEPRHYKWIRNVQKYGLLIDWPYRCNYYEKAKAIPGAKWESGIGMRVKGTSWKEIRDFADCYDFHITAGAEKELIKAEDAEKSASRVSPKAVEEKLQQEGKLDQILNSSRDVLDDLKDE